MATSGVNDSSLAQIQSNYTSYETNTSEAELAQDEFLTLLVAQLENQDPLNPTDSTEFTSQLAQFSQLEQMINLNEKIDVLIAQSEQTAQKSTTEYIGMQVSGSVNTMTIDNGMVSSGFYDLPEQADVVVTIQDDQGNTVRTIQEGQKEAGAYLVPWDGTDDTGSPLPDDTYTYTVMANSGNGYEEIPSNITGTVEGVSFQNGKEYLVVGGILLDPEAVTSVTEPVQSEPTAQGNTALEYLGTTVTTNYPIVLVEEGQVAGSDLSFHLNAPQDVTLTVYDTTDQVVQTIEIPADQTAAGENDAHWDGLESTGYQAADGMYYYTVSTSSGYAPTPETGEVTGIRTINGAQYLELGESGRLVSMSAITKVE